MIESIIASHKTLKKIYDIGSSPIEEIKNISVLCLDLISTNFTGISYNRVADSKKYIVYKTTGNSNLSRPVNQDLFISNSPEYALLWSRLISSINPANVTSSLSEDDINRVMYTTVLSFCICIDMWKPKSRKTPGTHFEVILGSIMSLFLPSHSREKFITLPGQEEKVSTDIVFQKNGSGIVIPAKITTRERIVQPYAHQRILDSFFGDDSRYRSILLCVSETQRDDKKKAVNDICVPGTLKLFQTHLSKLTGLYYLDPPTRYLNEDISSLITVGSHGKFLKSDLNIILS